MTTSSGGERSGEPLQFRVSDAVEVPLRGYLLRLKLLSGNPSLKDIKPGTAIRLRSPSGSERAVAIKDYSLVQGVASQKRLDRTRELDVVIDTADAVVNGEVVDIGWTVTPDRS